MHCSAWITLVTPLDWWLFTDRLNPVFTSFERCIAHLCILAQNISESKNILVICPSMKWGQNIFWEIWLNYFVQEYRVYCTVPSILRSYLSIAWCFHAIQVGSSYPVFRHQYLHLAALRANTDVFIQDNFSPTCIAFKHHAIHTINILRPLTWTLLGHLLPFSLFQILYK